MCNISSHFPASSPTHLFSVSFTDLQIDHVAKQVFILLTDHDKHLGVIHSLL